MVHHDPYATAKTLADLDAQMRETHCHRIAVAIRYKFYCTAVDAHAIARLNSLGRLAGMELSERSLNLIFEDDRYSHDVIRAVVARCDADHTFRSALLNQEGASCLDYWRVLIQRDSLAHRVAA